MIVKLLKLKYDILWRKQMKLDRYNIIEKQERAYFNGVVEKFNEEWILIDLETEEAYPLDEFIYKEIQVKRLNRWQTGILTENYVMQYDNKQFPLQDEDEVRIRKTFTISFQTWLDELNDEAYYQFIQKLNELGFSIFDSTFCHNYLSFLVSKEKEGVNFLMFDNTLHLCSVHHHFQYDEDRKNDRFEFTLNTGKRVVLQALQRPYKK